MAHSSFLGGRKAPQQPAGRSTGALGPSDSSDSGSDVQGEMFSADTDDEESRETVVPVDLDSDGDSSGTGDRAQAAPDGERDGFDIEPAETADLIDDDDDDGESDEADEGAD
jgi:hypothetical protein